MAKYSIQLTDIYRYFQKRKNNMGEKLIVIGSNSFSGAHFVDFVLSQGFEVIGISRSQEPHAVFLPYKKREKAKFTFYQLDLNNDFHEIAKLLYTFKPDYVVNFAAQGMVVESWQQPDQWYMTNLVSAVRLHDKLRDLNCLRKFVQISTPEVYGNCEGTIKESTEYNPSTPYAVSKAAVDMSLMCYCQAYDFPVTFTRAANVFGPGQQLYRIIPRAILFFLTGRKLPLHGGGQSVRSFIHINDIIDGTFRVCRHAPAGEIYHFATAKNISIYNLVKMIAEQLGVNLETSIEIVGDRLGKDFVYQLDSLKAKTELGWNDQVSLEQGIEETIGWVKDNMTVLNEQPLNYIHKP